MAQSSGFSVFKVFNILNPITDNLRNSLSDLTTATKDVMKLLKIVINDLPKISNTLQKSAMELSAVSKIGTNITKFPSDAKDLTSETVCLIKSFRIFP